MDKKHGDTAAAAQLEQLAKVASRSSSLYSSVEEELQQSGRSSTSLNAEFAATSLRGSGDGTSDNSDNVVYVARKLSTKSVPFSPTAELAVCPLSAQPIRWASVDPVVSSPLNTISKEPSIEGERWMSKGSQSSSSSSWSKSRAATNWPLCRPPRRASGVTDMSDIESQRPTTVQHLGSDYTRYYNPFTNRPRSNRSGTSTPIPPGVILATNPFSTPRTSTTRLPTQLENEKPHVVVLDDRLGAPYFEKGVLDWPSIEDQAEDDDDMHMPQPDDDQRYKPKLKDHFTRDSILSTIGLIFMVVGLLFIFIALPILSFSGVIDYNSMYQTPLDQLYNPWPEPEAWAVVNDRKYPLLKNIRTGLIDPTTPASAKARKNINGDVLELVFSDEFNDNNRTFYEGDDPYWHAADLWYGATQDEEYYDPDAVTSWEGALELRLDKFANHGLQFRSGMLNSWNQLCFKGGIFEVSVSLPGPAAVRGLWPGAWTMGNLGRPGYLSTTEGLWPYTYNNCDVGITPNQSSNDGLSRLPGQRLPSCTCPGEDHPTPGRGRGAPEIDIIEAGADWGNPIIPIATQSYQVAPFDIWYYPDYNFTMFPDYRASYINGYTGGPFQQALSATSNLNKQWYDGNAYQKYSFEYVPGDDKRSYIAWFVGDRMTWMLDARAIGPNGNIGQREISQEPMSMILNLGISGAWTVVDFEHLVFPTIMRIDYVRWYQKKGNHSVTCDPEGYESTQYIKDHMNAYTNPNFTHWDQTGHPWPKHQLNSNC